MIAALENQIDSLRKQVAAEQSSRAEASKLVHTCVPYTPPPLPQSLRAEASKLALIITLSTDSQSQGQQQP